MAIDREVKYNIKLTGVDDIKNSLRGVGESYEKMLKKQYEQDLRQAEKKKRLQDKQDREYARSLEKRYQEQKRLANAAAREEEREEKKALAAFEKAQKQRISALKAEERERKRIMQQAMREEQRDKRNRDLGLRGLGHIAQMAGYYRTGHLLRGVPLFDEMRGQGDKRLGLMELVSSIGPTIAGFAALTLVTKTVEFGFKTLMTEVTSLGSAFTDAIMSLGGVKSLAQQIINAGRLESAAAAASLSVPSSERLPLEQITSIAYGLAGNERFGGASAEDWMKGIRVLAEHASMQASGLRNPIVQGTLGSIVNIAKVSPSQAAELYSQIYNADRTQSPSDINARIRQLLAIGQTGNLSLSSIAATGGRMISIPGEFFGTPFSRGLALSASLASKITPLTASHTLEEAGTELQGLLRAVVGHKGAARGKAIGAVFDAAGAIANPEEVLANIISNPAAAARLIPELGKGREALPAIAHLRAQYNVKGVGDKERENVLAQMAADESLTLSTKELQKATKDATTDQEKLSAAWNRFEGALEPGLVKVLDDITAAVKQITDPMVKEAPNFAKSIEEVAKAFIALAPDAAFMGYAIQFLVSSLLHMIQILGTPAFAVETGWNKTFGKLFGMHSGLGDALGHLTTASDNAVDSLAKVSVALSNLNTATQPGPVGSALGSALEGGPGTIKDTSGAVIKYDHGTAAAGSQPDPNSAAMARTMQMVLEISRNLQGAGHDFHNATRTMKSAARGEE